MDIQNHYYGHSAVLATYLGLRRPRHIPGLLQHGWTLRSPVAMQMHDFPQVGRTPRRRLLVWSHSSRAWDPKEESRPTTAIGAPFLYQQLLVEQAGTVPVSRAGTVCLPFHSTRLLRVAGDHARLAGQVAELDGPCTVCLHVEDLSDAEIVRAWRSAGHTLVTAGRRDDPAFLPRIYALVAGAHRVVSNRLGTALLYGAATGAETGVYGDPLTLSTPEVDSVAAVRELWPELHASHVPVAVGQPLARAELGADSLRPPAELAALLGWTHPQPGPAAEYWLGAPVRKALNVLGVGRRAGGHAAPEAGASPLLWLRHPLDHLPKPLPRAAGDPRRLPALLPVPVPVPVPVPAPDAGPGRP